MGDHKTGSRGVLAAVNRGETTAEDALTKIAPEGMKEFVRRIAYRDRQGRASKLPIFGMLETMDRDAAAGETLFLIVNPRRVIESRRGRPLVPAKVASKLKKEAQDQLKRMTGDEDGRPAAIRMTEIQSMLSNNGYDGDARRNPNLSSAIEVAVRDGTISAKAAQRLLDSTKKAFGTVESAMQERGINLLAPRGRAVSMLVSEMASLAASRTAIYDATVMNPAGEMNGRVGRQLQHSANMVTSRARKLANIINRLTGDNREPQADGLPVQGSLGRQVYQQIMAGNGAIAYNSAKKLQRTGGRRLQLLQRYLADNGYGQE